MLRLWVDDLRTPPDDTWTWAKTSEEAIVWLDGPLEFGDWWWDEVSLDHDLGGDDTTRPVVLFMCENGAWPKKVVCHSANPVGRQWIEGMVARYKPGAS